MTDDALLERVRSLLAKAESSSFPAEAEAFTEKAQELMARHAIDDALVTSGGGSTGAPTTARREVTLTDPYAKQRFMLLGTVADANRATAVYEPARRVAHLFGDPGDLEAIELLFTSLLVQATTAMLQARSPRRAAASTTAAFRRSFLTAYAVRIGERLERATAAATRAASEGTGRAVLPVLARRHAAAQDAATAAFPRARPSRLPVSSAAGASAGLAAADQARIGDPERPLRR
jgi:hypothetical protein